MEIGVSDTVTLNLIICNIIVHDFGAQTINKYCIFHNKKKEKLIATTKQERGKKIILQIIQQTASCVTNYLV